MLWAPRPYALLEVGSRVPLEADRKYSLGVTADARLQEIRGLLREKLSLASPCAGSDAGGSVDSSESVPGGILKFLDALERPIAWFDECHSILLVVVEMQHGFYVLDKGLEGRGRVLCELLVGNPTK